MTIKVCKQKFEDRLILFFFGLWQVAMLGTTALVIIFTLVIGTDLSLTDFGIPKEYGLGLFFASMFGVIPHLFGLMIGIHWTQYLYKYIKEHQKIFEWNRDC